MTDESREERDRQFQERLLAILDKPAKRSRLAAMNSPFGIWFLTVIFVTMGGGYYTTYHQCIADGQRISAIYVAYKSEIQNRQNAIVDAIKNATTVDDLHKALDKKNWFRSELKDKTITELSGAYRATYLRVDRSHIDETAESVLIESPMTPRFTAILYGAVPLELTNADLPDLKQYAALVLHANARTFLHDLKTVFETKCTPTNVVRMALGGSPVIVRAVELPTFLERETHDVEQH